LIFEVTDVECERQRLESLRAVAIVSIGKNRENLCDMVILRETYFN